MHRFTFLRILLAQLILSTAEAEKEEFRLKFNHCAEAWNELAQEAQRNVWPVKKAKHVEELFTKLFQDPSWRIR